MPTKQAAVPAGGPIPNIFCVGAVTDGEVAIMRQPPGIITQEEARNLAAYLISVSGGLEAFLPTLVELEASQ